MSLERRLRCGHIMTKRGYKNAVRDDYTRELIPYCNICNKHEKVVFVDWF